MIAVILLCQFGKKLWKSIKNEFGGLEFVAINFVISEDIESFYYGNTKVVKVPFILHYEKNTLKDHLQNNHVAAINPYL